MVKLGERKEKSEPRYEKKNQRYDNSDIFLITRDIISFCEKDNKMRKALKKQGGLRL